MSLPRCPACNAPPAQIAADHKLPKGAVVAGTAGSLGLWSLAVPALAAGPILGPALAVGLIAAGFCATPVAVNVADPGKPVGYRCGFCGHKWDA